VVEFHRDNRFKNRMFSCLKTRIVAFFLLALMGWTSICYAEVRDLVGAWYQAPADWTYRGQTDIAAEGLQPVAKVALTGGYFWHQADFDVVTAGRYVLDFKNTSIIGNFRHILLDEQGRQLAEVQGGIESRVANPFFLRHGREVELPAGHYRLLTELDSPFFLAEPQPYLDGIDTYQQTIKPGNALTLLCLGMFIGLMIYYAAIAIVRKRLPEAMYSVFILGNLLFNGTGLLVFSELFGLHWIYLTSIPILFSNCAYVVFVMSLLEIKESTHPRLRKAGLWLLGLLGGLIVLAMIKPNWSLEIDRYGVGLFLTYGLITGISRAREGSVSAQYYLYAIGTFFVLGITTITTSSLGGTTLFIEHMGLLSVSVEVMLLALVLSYQFAQLYRDKEHALERMEHSTRAARTDALTGLPNRVALDLALEILPQHGCLTFIDLDGLKFYNDQFGHERGDDLLRSFASNLSNRLGVGGQAHRLGGDEFAITCEHGDAMWVDSALEQAIEDMCASGFEFAGASYGSVHVHEHPNLEEIKRMADRRMYENKRRRKLQRYQPQESRENQK
jgi:diguanylate cyclase (GGDEF)-like protein